MSVIRVLEDRLKQDKNFPDFRAGDKLVVKVKIIEGGKERSQDFAGVCIARRSRGAGSSFVVRKKVGDVGVERIFPLFSPMIKSIEVVQRGRVRRAKLYYLRSRIGRAANIPILKK